MLGNIGNMWSHEKIQYRLSKRHSRTAIFSARRMKMWLAKESTDDFYRDSFLEIRKLSIEIFVEEFKPVALQIYKLEYRQITI